MNPDFASTRKGLMTELARRGLKIAEDALKPLQRIDFAQLVQIHDHEEHFLRMTFLESLENAYRARLEEERGPKRIIAQDVRTAMLMLGAAAANAPEAKFSGVNKTVIKDLCPYCVPTTTRASTR
jgi:hypothetical protein